MANVRTGEAMWPNAPMHLDSQTKTWVATVILQLVADGRMRLDDTVERWLPGVLPYGKRITVRELLDHTSGIVDQQTFDTDALRSSNESTTRCSVQSCCVSGGGWPRTPQRSSPRRRAQVHSHASSALEAR